MKESLSQVDSIINTMKSINELTAGFMNKVITDSLNAWQNIPCQCSTASDVHHGVPNDARIICPPRDNCPPRCLLTIERHCNIGEVINVPFRVKNGTNFPKTYHLGVREITDKEGTVISQPTLDKVELKVQPGMSAAAEMRIVLNKYFVPGSLYETDIVIRERKHNQNICFRLYVNADMEIPEALPYDERDIDTHFHRWYHHYYCENERLFSISEREPSDNIVVTKGKQDKEVKK
jgi:hypothetical protein